MRAGRKTFTLVPPVRAAPGRFCGLGVSRSRSHCAATIFYGHGHRPGQSEWPYVYLYPWLHPCYQQSQVHELGTPAPAEEGDDGFASYSAARNLTVSLDESG